MVERDSSQNDSADGAADHGEPPPLRSLHTTSFPKILNEIGASVLVTTYQAGKLVMLRADGDVLNTHFRSFAKPMGMAVDEQRLAIGTAIEIWEYHNMPAVARKLEPVGKHDVCFLPRRSHTTGDTQVHEMAWVDGQVWFVNTRFSCLCSRSDEYSFRPEWRPSFVSAIAPEDRCHLNGLGLRDGKVRWATALGETDTPAGWRDNKRDGGILIDVQSDKVVACGLSMPHSPRWHDGRLWVLHSGTGGIGTIDPSTGHYESLAELPGFTRGLSFCGPWAFVGLSQVRESAVFSGIPLVDRLAERTCGVWVLNINTGETLAFVKFEDAVQEIFAVEVLPSARFPDLINDDEQLLAGSYVLPDEALRDVPKEVRDIDERST